PEESMANAALCIRKEAEHAVVDTGAEAERIGSGRDEPEEGIAVRREEAEIARERRLHEQIAAAAQRDVRQGRGLEGGGAGAGGVDGDTEEAELGTIEPTDKAKHGAAVVAKETDVGNRGGLLDEAELGRADRAVRQEAEQAGTVGGDEAKIAHERILHKGI